MKSLISAAALMVAVLASIASATAPGIKTKWAIPLGAQPSNGAAGGGGGMFYTQIDGHSVGYNLTTKMKTFDKEISGGQVKGFLALEKSVLVITNSGNAMAFSHSGKFLWDSGDFVVPTHSRNYRVIGNSLIITDGFSLKNVDLLTGLVSKHVQCSGAVFVGAHTAYAVVTGTEHTEFTKFDFKAGSSTAIANGAENWGNLLSVSGNLAVFSTQTQKSFHTEIVSRSLTTGAEVGSSGALKGANEASLAVGAFGGAIIAGEKQLANGETPITVRLVTDLSAQVGNFTLPAVQGFNQQQINVFHSNDDLYVFTQGLVKISGTTGTVARTPMRIGEVPTCKTNVVVNLGAVTMVPNLQGYTLWNSTSMDLMWANEVTPPTEFQVYEYNGEYLNILGTDLVAWVSTFPQ